MQCCRYLWHIWKMRCNPVNAPDSTLTLSLMTKHWLYSMGSTALTTSEAERRRAPPLIWHFCQCKSANDSGSLLAQKQCQSRGRRRSRTERKKKIMMKWLYTNPFIPCTFSESNYWTEIWNKTTAETQVEEEAKGKELHERDERQEWQQKNIIKTCCRFSWFQYQIELSWGRYQIPDIPMNPDVFFSSIIHYTVLIHSVDWGMEWQRCAGWRDQALLLHHDYHMHGNEQNVASLQYTGK